MFYITSDVLESIVHHDFGVNAEHGFALSHLMKLFFLLHSETYDAVLLLFYCSVFLYVCVYISSDVGIPVNIVINK